MYFINLIIIIYIYSTPNRQVITKLDTDNFKFIVKDKNVERITIILNQISGDTTLFTSRDDEYPPSQIEKRKY